MLNDPETRGAGIRTHATYTLNENNGFRSNINNTQRSFLLRLRHPWRAFSYSDAHERGPVGTQPGPGSRTASQEIYCRTALHRSLRRPSLLSSKVYRFDAASCRFMVLGHVPCPDPNVMLARLFPIHHLSAKRGSNSLQRSAWNSTSTFVLSEAAKIFPKHSLPAAWTVQVQQQLAAASRVLALLSIGIRKGVYFSNILPFNSVQCHQVSKSNC